MIIPIDGKYRLKSDPHCWHLQMHHKTQKGEEVWVSKYYFSRLEEACEYLVQLRLRLCDGDTLAKALGEVETTVSSLVRALSPRFRVEVRDE